MKELLDVYKMSEVSVQTRVSLIIKIGKFLNDQYGMNISEPLVYELVELLDPAHEILSNSHYKKMAGR